MSEFDYQTTAYWNRRTRDNLGDERNMLFRDHRFEEYDQRTREELIQWKDLAVLDIACGFGRFANMFEDYTGVDFSREMIKLANQKHPGKLFTCIDVRTAPIPERMFDVIFECNSLKCLGQTPMQFFEKYKSHAKKAVACLEADVFTIYHIYEDTSK